MNNSNSDYYGEMVDFTTNNNVFTVVTTSSFYAVESTFTNYTVTVRSTIDLQEYTFLVPDKSLVFTESDQLTIEISPYNNEYYYLHSIDKNGQNIYENITSCPSNNCIEIVGTVETINRPNNLNYQFANNSIVQNELSKLTTGTVDLSNHMYEDGYWYKSTDNAIDVLVFIHELKISEYIITIIPIEDTTTIIHIVSQYNYYVYLTAIAIIFLWSFRLSAIISKPIQNIDIVAKEIAELNFNVIAEEYNNKETSSLSNSINLISNNLKDALQNLNNKNEELTTLYQDQSKQVELKKQLVSSISHELKTPLMIMQVIIQGLIDGVIEQVHMEEELSTVLKEINKSSVMIQDMLQIYRLDDSNSFLEIETVDITKELSYLLNEFDQIIQKQSLQIIANTDEHIFIKADKKLIRRVLSNFLTNAIKYTPKGETIEITLHKSNNVFTFNIVNYGVTIHHKDIKNIWLPFYRGPQSNYTDQKQSGSGIGLYLVKEILLAHKADFGIVNVERGVKAYFILEQKNDS